MKILLLKRHGGGGGICYFWHVALQLEIHGVDQASFKHTEILLFVPPE